MVAFITVIFIIASISHGVTAASFGIHCLCDPYGGSSQPTPLGDSKVQCLVMLPNGKSRRFFEKYFSGKSSWGWGGGGVLIDFV